MRPTTPHSSSCCTQARDLPLWPSLLQAAQRSRLPSSASDRLAQLDPLTTSPRPALLPFSPAGTTAQLLGVRAPRTARLSDRRPRNKRCFPPLLRAAQHGRLPITPHTTLFNPTPWTTAAGWRGPAHMAPSLQGQAASCAAGPSTAAQGWHSQAPQSRTLSKPALKVSIRFMPLPYAVHSPAAQLSRQAPATWLQCRTCGPHEQH